MILLDANILIHSRQPGSPHHPGITGQLESFILNEKELLICPQVLYEYYVVVTRPAAQNGYGISANEALQQIQEFKEVYTYLNDPDDLMGSWQNIIATYQTIGKQGHDARIVALMRSHGVTHIYTMNPGDFTRYSNIITILN
jgi:predicted nucleic acid-binding protein